VPMIWSVPGGARGKAVDDVVESLDVVPTLLDLWGAKHTGSTYHTGTKNTQLDGTSLMHYIQADKYPSLPRKQYALSELRISYSDLNLETDDENRMLAMGKSRLNSIISTAAQLNVRSKDWSYTAYLIPPADCRDAGMVVGDETLYNLIDNPGESINLAYKKDYKAKRAEFLQVAQKEWDFKLSNWTEPDREARLAMVQTLSVDLRRIGKCSGKAGVKLGGSPENLIF